MANDYQKIRNELQKYFEEENFPKALEIAKEIRDQFPDRYIASHYNLAYSQAALNQIEDVITTLEEALEKGAWYSANELDEFPNIESLKSNPRFQNILKKFQQCFEEERKQSKRKWVVREPPDYDPAKSYPLLIALHWHNSNIDEFEPYWKDVVLNTGVLLALPQSSQLFGLNSYTWRDIDLSLEELEQTFSELKEKYNIDPTNVFLSGASLGGQLALEATFLKPKFPVKGVIAVIPHVIEPPKFSTSLNQLINQKIKCCLVTGTHDSSYEPCKEFVNLLQKHSIKYLFYESVGTGHMFPPNFDEILQEIMRFLLDK